MSNPSDSGAAGQPPMTTEQQLLQFMASQQQFMAGQQQFLDNQRQFLDRMEARDKKRDDDQAKRDKKRDDDQEKRDKKRDDDQAKRDKDQVKRHNDIMEVLKTLVAANSQTERQLPPLPEQCTAIGTRTRDKFTEVDIRTIWTCAGLDKYADWVYYIQPNGAFGDQDIDNILETYRGIYNGDRQTFDPEAESECQDAVNALFAGIEEHRGNVLGDDTRTFWHDRHNSPIPGGITGDREPDGILSPDCYDASMSWRMVTAVVELKHTNRPYNDSELRGQLIFDFEDMANNQPRRYSVGLSMVEDCMLYMYLCTPTWIWQASIDTLPNPLNADADARRSYDRRVIRVLLGIYKILSADPGFLVQQPEGMYGSFTSANIPGLVPDNRGTSVAIRLGDGEAMLGRHRHLSGTRSWTKDARCSVNEGAYIPCYVKINWSTSKHTEACVHRTVFGMGELNIPQVLYSATIAAPGESGVRGELLVVSDAGKPFDVRFSALARQPQVFVDVIAGYLDTLFKAATGDGRHFILHRDISAGNLLVDKGNRPWIIDWGFGLLAPSQGRKAVSTDPRLGTTVFMSIRVLLGKATRSIIDDLESLFLILSYCAWGEYGRDRDGEAALWRGDCLKDFIVDARGNWLQSREMYFMRMDLQGCPAFLQELLEKLHSLLFAGGTGAIIYEEADPRDDTFDAGKWVDALDKALYWDGEAGPESRLVSLRKYVQVTLGCCCPYGGESVSESCGTDEDSSAEPSTSVLSASKPAPKRETEELPDTPTKKAKIPPTPSLLSLTSQPVQEVTRNVRQSTRQKTQASRARRGNKSTSRTRPPGQG